MPYVFGIRQRVESGSGRLKTRGGKTPFASPIARLRPPTIPAACLTRLRQRNTAVWPQPEARVNSGMSGSVRVPSHTYPPLTMVDIRLSSNTVIDQALAEPP
jgi:hypothetical protein